MTVIDPCVSSECVRRTVPCSPTFVCNALDKGKIRSRHCHGHLRLSRGPATDVMSLRCVDMWRVAGMQSMNDRLDRHYAVQAGVVNPPICHTLVRNEFEARPEFPVDNVALNLRVG